MIKHEAEHKLRFSKVSNDVDSLTSNQRGLILYFLLGGISSSFERNCTIDAEKIINIFETCIEIARNADPKQKAPWLGKDI